MIFSLAYYLAVYSIISVILFHIIHVAVDPEKFYT